MGTVDEISIADSGFAVLKNPVYVPKMTTTDNQSALSRSTVPSVSRQHRMLQFRQKRGMRRVDTSTVASSLPSSYPVPFQSKSSAPASPTPSTCSSASLESIRSTRSSTSTVHSTNQQPLPPQLTRDDVYSIVRDVVREKQPNQPPSVERPLSPSGSRSGTYDKEYEEFRRDDMRYRVEQMKGYGQPTSASYNPESADSKRMELEHWRMKLNLEERELHNNTVTFVAIMGDMIEGMCTALDFDSFRTKNLSSKIDKAIHDGKFQSAIRHWCASGGGQFMKNPSLNFLVTFLGICLKNHLTQKPAEKSADKPADKPAEKPEASKSATNVAAGAVPAHALGRAPYMSVPAQSPAVASRTTAAVTVPAKAPVVASRTTAAVTVPTKTPVVASRTTTAVTVAPQTTGTLTSYQPTVDDHKHDVVSPTTTAVATVDHTLQPDRAPAKKLFMASTANYQQMDGSLSKVKPVLKHVSKMVHEQQSINRDREELEKSGPKSMSLLPP